MAEATCDFAAPMARSLAPQSDESLIRSVCEGDEAAFESLFERHKRQVARTAGRFFTQTEKVEEIVQETFTKAYFALSDYSPDRGAAFSTWLTRIAINACFDQLRQSRRRPETLLSDVTSGETLEGRIGATANTAESDLISRDLANKLLARLRAEDRLVLTLLDAEEMSVREIAKITGWSASKVKVRAYRARAALRRVLSELL
jgi:RNA polymerase sigma-70 factor (ECF subfamily)